jgi:alpha-tubulin suppressor-like RCC1 family protein
LLICLQIDRVMIRYNSVINHNALSRRKKAASPSPFAKHSNLDTIPAKGSQVWVWGNVESLARSIALVDADHVPPSSINPFVIPQWSDKKIVAATASPQGLLAISHDGMLHTLSMNASELSVLSTKPKAFLRHRVKQVSCNQSVCFAVTEGGMLFSWHLPDAPSQPWLLGRESPDADVFVPCAIESVSNAVNVAVGDAHVLVLREDMQVMSWGVNDCGQLGHGNRDHSRKPQRIQALRSYRIIDIAAGGFHSIALTLDGRVYVWGRGEEGQLGTGAEDDCLLPYLIEQPGQLVACVAGSRHTAVLSNRGVLYISGSGFPTRTLEFTQVCITSFTIARLITKKINCCEMFTNFNM